MTRWLALLPALLFAACSAAPESAPELTREAEPVHATDPAPVKAPALRIAVGVDVAEDALAALDLWREATDGAFAPEVTVSDDCTGANWCIRLVDEITDAECADPSTNNISRAAGPRACSWRENYVWYITISRAATLPAERVSSLAHEAGHALGLHHQPGTGDLMDPDRPQQARVAPCVSLADVDGAGFSGPGTCGE